MKKSLKTSLALVAVGMAAVLATGAANAAATGGGRGGKGTSPGDKADPVKASADKTAPAGSTGVSADLARFPAVKGMSSDQQATLGAGMNIPVVAKAVRALEPNATGDVVVTGLSYSLKGRTASDVEKNLAKLGEAEIDAMVDNDKHERALDIVLLRVSTDAKSWDETTRKNVAQLIEVVQGYLAAGNLSRADVMRRALADLKARGINIDIKALLKLC